MGLNNDNNHNNNAASAPPPATYSPELLIAHAKFIANSSKKLFEALQESYEKATGAMFRMTRTQVRSIVAKSIEEKQNIIVTFLQIFINSHDFKKPLTHAFKIPSQPLPERGNPEWKAIIKAMHDEGLLVYHKGIVFASTFKYFNLELFKGNGTDPVNDTTLGYDPAQAQKAYDEYLERKKIQENFGIVITEFMKKNNIEIDFIQIEKYSGISSKSLFKKLYDLKSWALLAELVQAINKWSMFSYPGYGDDMRRIENNSDPDCILFKKRVGRGSHWFNTKSFDEWSSDKYPLSDLDLDRSNYLNGIDLSQDLVVENSRIPQKISQMIDWEMFGTVYQLVRNLSAPLAVKIIPAISDDNWKIIVEFNNKSSLMVQTFFEKIMVLDLKSYQVIFPNPQHDYFMSHLLDMNMLVPAQQLYVKFHEIYQCHKNYDLVIKNLSKKSYSAAQQSIRDNPENPLELPSLVLALFFKRFYKESNSFYNCLLKNFSFAYQCFKAMSLNERLQLANVNVNLFPAIVSPLYKDGSNIAINQCIEMLLDWIKMIEKGTPQFEWSFDNRKIIYQLMNELLSLDDPALTYGILKNSSPNTLYKIIKAFIGCDAVISHDSDRRNFEKWITSTFDNKFYALEFLFSNLSFRDVSGFISELKPLYVRDIYYSVFRLRPASHPLIIKSLVWMMWLLKGNKLGIFASNIRVIHFSDFQGPEEAPFAAALYLMAPEYFQENHQTFHSSLVNEHFKKNPDLGKNIFLEVQKELQQYYLNNASAPVGYEESLAQNPPQAPIIPANTDLDEEEQEAAHQRRRGKQPQGFMTQTEKKLLERLEGLEQQMSQLLNLLKQPVDQSAQKDDQAKILALQKEVERLESEKLNSNKHHQKMQTNLLRFSQRPAPNEPPKKDLGRRASLSNLSTKSL